MPIEWLTIAEAAALIKVHPRTVERRAAAGKIESRRNDDGQVQVLIDVPEPTPTGPEPVSVEAFETVREMADRQVDIAAGSASALVRAAQEQAMRAEHQVELHKQEAGRYRREAQMAMALVALIFLLVLGAVMYGTSVITAAKADAQGSRERAVVAEETAKRATNESAQAREQVSVARAAKANAEGELKAYKAGVATVIEQTRPATRPATFFDRITAAFTGN